MLGVTQRRGFRVGCDVCLLAHVGRAQDSQSLRVGRHDSVLHSVVHHLDEVAGAIWPAVKVALLSGALDLVPAGGARNVAHSGGERGEDWVETLDHLALATDHHAVTPFQAPHTSAGAHIHIVDLSGSELLCPPDIVHVIRIASVDENVSRLKVRQKVSDRAVNNCGRNH